MTTTHDENSTLPAAPVLYVALELGWNTWKLAFTIGAGQKPRIQGFAGVKGFAGVRFCSLFSNRVP